MNFQLDEDTILLRDSIRELGKQKAEHVAGWDADRALPGAWIEELSELGLLAMRVPEADGGAGLTTLAAMAVLEELAQFSAATAFTVAVHNVLGLGHADAQAAAPVEEGVLLGFADGGSTLTAVGSGDAWTLQGTVELAFGATGAGAWVVTATVEGAHQAFLVRRSDAVRSSRARTLGLRAADIGTLRVEGATATRLDSKHARVAADWTAALGFLAAGIGRAALAEGTAYAKDRQQFGKPIAAFQAIQWKLADLATALDAAELMLGVAANRDDEGRTAAIARATLAAVEPVTQGCSNMLQVHGGYGYTEEYAIERLYRDARAVALYAGVRARTKAVVAEAVAQRFSPA